MAKRTAKISSNENSESLEKVDGETNLSKMSLGDISSLLMLGRLSESISISGFEFIVSTLSASDQRDVVKNIMKMDEDDRILSAKAMTLAHCISSINGVPFDEVCGTSDEKASIGQKIEFVLNMQSTLVDRLFSVYEDLIKRSNEQVGVEDLKK